MEQAISVFINGIIGVFAGMAVLYVMIRLMTFVAEHLEQKPDQGNH